MPTISIVRRTYAPALVAIVGASFVLRTAVAWLRSTPALFPDEYIYASIGRSLAESGRPLIRGGPAHFPALLQPIVTSPAWLIGDVGVAFRLVQSIGALAMSLAAVPVYLLARRLGLSGRIALVLSAFAVLVPDLLYASFISSECLAYPLLLTSVYAATRALSRPTRRAQLLFVAAAGLTTLARVQFAALPVVFALATVAVGIREHRVKAALREQALALGIFAVAATGALAAGPSSVFGVYRWLFGFHAGALGIAHWGALDAMTVAYAAGWVIIPGALLGLWLALSHPRTREELAFGVIVALLIAALLFEAGLLQASLSVGQEIQERYVFYAVPLLGLCFALYASRGWPLRLPHLALAAGLVLVSVRMPLSAYARATTADGSPVLFAVYWLTGKLGGPGVAASVVVAAVGLMSAVAVLASRRPRIGTPVVLGLAVLAVGAASAGAVALDIQSTVSLKKTYLPSDPSWVDRAGVGHVTLLQSFSGVRAISLQELFWNRSITRVALLPGAARLDSFRADRVHVGGDGSMTSSGGPLDGPLLVDTFGSTVRLRGATMLAAGPTAALWVPDGPQRPRLALYAPGRYYDGWLAAAGAIHLWPATAGGPVSGWLSLKVAAAHSLGPSKLTFVLPGGRRVTVHLQPGSPKSVRLAVCASRLTRVGFRTNRPGFVGLRAVSVKATAPIFTSSARACPAFEPAS